MPNRPPGLRKEQDGPEKQRLPEEALKARPFFVNHRAGYIFNMNREVKKRMRYLAATSPVHAPRAST
jgi:hypothetical protein